MDSIDRGRRQPSRIAANLLLATHPLPTAAVTGLVVVLARGVGTPVPAALLLAAAVLCGQISVGLLNDLVDIDRDRAAGRHDKPLATGRVSERAGWTALGIATVLCVGLSLALGAAPAVAHLTAVASAWAYNLGVKSTVWSWLPYAIGFGLLPVTVWLVSPLDSMPGWWLIAAAALLGMGAHGANVLPDLTADRAAGVWGLPQRLGTSWLRAATTGALLAGLALVTLGPSSSTAAWEAAVLVVGAILALAAAFAGRTDQPLVDRWAFLAAIAIGVLAVAVMVARGAAG